MPFATYVRDPVQPPLPPPPRPVVRANAAMQQVTEVVEGDAADVLALSSVDPSINEVQSAVGPGPVMGPASPYPDLSRGPGFGGPGVLAPQGRAFFGGGAVPSTGEQGWFRYGLLDASILTLGAMAGVAVERKLSPRASGGYGIILGALAANAIADAFSTRGAAGSWRDGMKAFLGAAIPMAPLALAVGMRRPLKGGTALALGGLTALVLVGLTHRQLSNMLAGRA